MVSKEHTRLRWGYSTGACAAAVAVAAWLRLRDGVQAESVSLHFSDGRQRRLPLLPPPSPYMACIRKNGGDDPDCTHGATVCARLRAATPDEYRPEDYFLRVADADLILRGGTGIGLCTRAGLDCEPGHWAINSGPRRMLTDNLCRAGLRSGCWLLEISIPEGVELARHTLNPQLGIEGGLSLLGTTGLVRPYSHEAYLATIRICVEGHARDGGRSMVFCTGGRTRKGAGRCLPDLPESAFVCIGDFIAESLGLACRLKMEEIVVACMAGKLCKYAAGFRNTHAAKNRQDMALLRAEARRCLPEDTAAHEALAHSVSVREALLSLPDEARPALLRRLARSSTLTAVFFSRKASRPAPAGPPSRRTPRSRCRRPPLQRRKGGTSGRPTRRKAWDRTISCARKTSVTDRWTSSPAALASLTTRPRGACSRGPTRSMPRAPCWRPAPCP